jgi:putative ABC transport system permease protein
MTVYRWLLRLAAPSLSREYGRAMEETLDGRLSEARDHTWWQRVRFWCRELATLAALAWSERFGEGTSGRRRRQREYNQFKAGPMDTLGQELHQAARRLLRSPAFTAASVLTLALAIGANTAIFAVVERVVWNPLPYPDSDRIIELDHGSVTLRVAAGMANSPGLYFLYRDRSQSLESAALFTSVNRTITGRGDPERIVVTQATPSLESVLRVRPALGRWFTEAEGEPGGAVVVVLSHGLWTRRFGRDAAVLGQTLILDGRPVEIVGVMPPGFAFPSARVEAWMPEQVSVKLGFGLFGHEGVARLREGVSLETARAELQGLIAGMAEAYPDDPRAAGNVSTKLTFTGRTLKDRTLGGIGRALAILLAAVGVVLLVACANVANLFLVRSELRQREVAIRRALGAGRIGLARYFLTESSLLALAGGVVGLFIAWGGLQMLVRSGPSSLPRMHEIQLQPIAIGYVAMLALMAAAAFGAIPLWRGTGAAALHESGRANTATRHRHGVRHLLLGSQVAMSLILLVASALMVRSALNLRRIDPGFNPDSTLTFSIGLQEIKHPTVEGAVMAHQEVIERVASLPGVVSASATTCLPLSMGCNGNTLRVEGETYPAGTLPPLALYRAVADRYFETMGMRILRGRSIDRADVDRQEPVAVISQSLAKSAFKGQDPIGRRVASNQPPRGKLPPQLIWLTVVGVVTDHPMQALNEPTAMPYLFMPLSLGRAPGTTNESRIAPGIGTLHYAVRTSVTPEGLVPMVRQSVKTIDPNLPVFNVSTLQQLVDRSSSQMTFTMVLLAIAAIVSLVLGVIGIYGVTSYIVSQRTGEIGVRLALGAAPRGITRQIVKQGGLVALAGIVVGLGTAAAGSRLIASVLYGVSPRDPAIFAAMSVLLLLVALLACWIPARRAAQLSPTIALRTE